MKQIVNALAVIAWCVAMGFCGFVIAMSIYIFKQARWDANLKRYRFMSPRVINPQGHIIETPEELLKELQGVEERIAK